MFYNNLILQSLIQFFIVLVLVFGVIGFAVGIGLIVSSAGTFRFFRAISIAGSPCAPLSSRWRYHGTPIGSRTNIGAGLESAL